MALLQATGASVARSAQRADGCFADQRYAPAECIGQFCYTAVWPPRARGRDAVDANGLDGVAAWGVLSAVGLARSARG